MDEGRRLRRRFLILEGAGVPILALVSLAATAAAAEGWRDWVVMWLILAAAFTAGNLLGCWSIYWDHRHG